MIRLLLISLYKPSEGILELKKHLLEHPSKWERDDYGHYKFNKIRLTIDYGWSSMKAEGTCQLNLMERAYLWGSVRKSMNMNSDIIKANMFKEVPEE